jgi:predicted DNA-binding transcriptional regulator YafY
MWAKHLVKILKAVDLLSRSEGATIDELGENLEIDRRTVYRMRETLEELGFPLYEDDSSLDRKKHWKLEERFLKKLPNRSLPDLNLSLSDIIALHIIKGHSRIYQGTDIEQAINTAFAKLDAFMPEKLGDRIAKIRTLFVPSAKFAKDYSGKETIIEAVTDAVLRQETCLVEYHSFSDDTVKGFKIDPLHFFERDGGLYLFVRATSFGDIRILAIERINKLTSTGNTYEYPKDFDPDALLAEAFNLVYDDPVSVKIWFAPDQARYIKERQWAKTQHITENPDCSLILELETSGWYEVKRWILSFGSDAEVLSPKKLRDDVKDELRQANLKYV